MKNLGVQEFISELRKSEEGRNYLKLIEKVRSERRGIKKESGFEVHHIQPRGLGGAVKSSENLIKFTVLEHCVAHTLLAKAVPCLETFAPILKMSYRQVKSLSDLDRITLDEIYGWSKLRKQAREEHSKAFKGTVRLYDPKNNYSWKIVRGQEELSKKLQEGFVQVQKVQMCNEVLGKNIVVFPWQVEDKKADGWKLGGLKKGPVSEEVRKKLSESHKGGKSHLGIPVSEETRAKIAETLRRKGCRPPSSKGKKRLYKVGSSKFILVKPEDVENYLKQGYEIRKSGYVKKGTCSATGKVWIHKDGKDMRVLKRYVQNFLEQGYVLGYSDSHRKKLSESHKGNIPWNKGKKGSIKLGIQ